MEPTLTTVRRATRLGDDLPERCQLCGREDDLHVHHVGGRRYSDLAIRLCQRCHADLTRAQASYQHLLDMAHAPGWIREMIWRNDAAALIEAISERQRLLHLLLDRIATHERHCARDLVEPHLSVPEERALLKRQKTGGPMHAR